MRSVICPTPGETLGVSPPVPPPPSPLSPRLFHEQRPLMCSIHCASPVLGACAPAPQLSAEGDCASQREAAVSEKSWGPGGRQPRGQVSTNKMLQLASPSLRQPSVPTHPCLLAWVIPLRTPGVSLAEAHGGRVPGLRRPSGETSSHSPGPELIEQAGGSSRAVPLRCSLAALGAHCVTVPCFAQPSHLGPLASALSPPLWLSAVSPPLSPNLPHPSGLAHAWESAQH